MTPRETSIIGSILGTAVGDALGLPYENVSRRRATKLFGPPDRYRFIFRRGMVSDDTEHTCMVAQALLAAGDDEDRFARELARRLRWWLVGLPLGTGKATLRAAVKLCLGVPPQRSGVFSAGNGPAMRAPILGAAIGDLDQLVSLVRVSSRITHTDPKAEHGALAVALAARMAKCGDVVTCEDFAEQVREVVAPTASEFLTLMDRVVEGVQQNSTVEDFAATLGLARGVTGYVYHTVPVALLAWLRHQGDFPGGVTSVIRCGGDTDTTAAIVGGILGASQGKAGIPQAWLDGLFEWPRTVAWMEELGSQLADAIDRHTPARPPRLPAAGLLLRNLLFATIVMAHVGRRLLPPY